MIRRGATLLFALLVLPAGCSRKGPTLPSTVPVKGKITLPSGQVLRAGRVELVAKVRPPGFDAFGDIEADGTFTLRSGFSMTNDGVVPGDYVATVSPINYLAKGGNPVKIPNAAEVPGRYQDAKTSDLVVTVQAGKDMFLDLKLKR